MNITSKILLFILIVVIIICWYLIPCFGPSCNDLANDHDKIITSNKCTNLHKIALDKQASVCIARDDTGITSIGWFSEPGCPNSKACPGNSTGDTLTMGYPSDISKTSEKSDISKTSEKRELCLAINSGHSKECFELIVNKPVPTPGAALMIIPPHWYVINDSYGNVECKCNNYNFPFPFTCTAEQLADPPSPPC